LYAIIVGPRPGAPRNVNVSHGFSDAVKVVWDPPVVPTPDAPILYYRVEYRTEVSVWNSSDPVLANKTYTYIKPPINKDRRSKTKYYIRVRAYGLLQFSDHSEAKIIFLPSK